MNVRKRSPFRHIAAGLLVGLVTAMLLYLDVGQSAEIGVLRLRNYLATLMAEEGSTAPITIFEMDSTGGSLAPDLSSLPNKVDLVSSYAPKAIVLYLDLRQAKVGDELLKAIKRNQSKIVVAYFGIQEKTPNIYAELAASGTTCGYTHLSRLPYGITCLLPLDAEAINNTIEPLPPILPLASAVVLTASPQTYRMWMEGAQKYPHGTKFYLDSTRSPKIETALLSELDNRKAQTLTDLVKDKIVIFANPEDRYVPTLASESMTPVSVHVQAINTLLDNVHIADFDTAGKWLMLPLGALIGALFHTLKPLQRIQAILIWFVLLLIAGQITFQLFHVILPLMPPLMVALACYLSCCLIFLEVENIDTAREVAVSLDARTEQERKRISQEIHDDTLPALTRIKRIAKSMDAENDVNQDQICEYLDLTITDMRRLVDDLHPLALDNLGLGPALESLVTRFAKHSKILADFTASSTDLDTMSASEKLAVYRIVQEALNNIEKHSQASQAEVAMAEAGGWLTISIADNGKGLPVESANGSSHGLANIRERARLIGATVNWKTPDRYPTGTEVVLRLKL